MTPADEHTTSAKPTETATATATRGRSGWARAVLWGPGLAVAFGAAAATAHGLFEVALAARVPAGIAWLYPLITDGLALVAYAATARLSGREARYAWAVVIVAAGLSGLAQAVYLATDPTPGPAGATGPVLTAPPVLRFGIGAWPAVAAAVVAHLLYLLAAHPVEQTATALSVPGIDTTTSTAISAGERSPSGVQPGPYDPAAVQPPGQAGPVQPVPSPAPAAVPDPGRSPASPLRDRAEQAATRHARRHGHWPTVSELETAAEVSRGTAAAALKALRDRPLPAPHLAAPPPGRPAERPAAPPAPAADHQLPSRHRLDDEAHTP